MAFARNKPSSCIHEMLFGFCIVCLLACCPLKACTLLTDEELQTYCLVASKDVHDSCIPCFGYSPLYAPKETACIAFRLYAHITVCTNVRFLLRGGHLSV